MIALTIVALLLLLIGSASVLHWIITEDEWEQTEQRIWKTWN